ncbi:hypothetical protein AB4Y42_39770 [Paraburkholderia sp. EG286B]|uniref:hypothetical protein n=1 Tax=Paraburkholderia sp. EG286B TaxID=3237011 RepID=UPI0034D1D16F
MTWRNRKRLALSRAFMQRYNDCVPRWNPKSSQEPVSGDQVKARYKAIVASLGKDEFKAHIITVPNDEAAEKMLDALRFTWKSSA